ncbi:SwmB domain-containing protein [Caulobacter segnis]|uniref:SwmB domain-containing protein n=1 Tax=Caulobacter segnis TaxID=88688 RepID=UPI0024100AE7|nr:SwmB domain-containing protein [Caulobacter segnis]MDG2520656.1 SwmB domain-containing protein [Caulobacter segnis]
MSIIFTVGDDNHLAGPERGEPITIRGEGATPGSTLQVTFGAGDDAVTIQIEVADEVEWGGFFEGYIAPETHPAIYELFLTAVTVSVFDGTQSASVLVTVPGEGAVLSEPTISTSSGVGLVRAGQTIIFEVASDKEVSVDGAPYLDLGNGRRALYSATESTTTNLTFVYTVQSADHGHDLSMQGLQLAGARIRTNDGASASASWNTVEVNVEIDTVAPDRPDVDAIAGDNRINITEAASTVVIEGKAEAASTVEITLGGLTRSVTAGPDGGYSYALVAADYVNLGQDAQFITVRSVDAAGNASQTATRQLAVDTIAPAEPAIDAIAGDSVINAAEAHALTISGSGEAGSTAFMRLGGVDSQAAASGGSFTFDLSPAAIEALGDGAHILTFWLVDPAGNVGPSTTRTVTIDTVAPTTPSIGTVAGDDVIDAGETDVVISGQTEAGSTVTLSFAGVTRAAEVAGSSWTYTLTVDDLAVMGDGGETLSAVARDSAGNRSSTVTRDIIIGATPAPTGPVLVSGNVAGAHLILRFDLALDAATALDPAAFTVFVDGASANVASAGFGADGHTVVLTLAAPVAHDQAVTVGYADPDPAADDENVVQSLAGVDAAGFSGRPVQNLTAAPPPQGGGDDTPPAPPPPQPGQQPGLMDLGGVAVGADLQSPKAAAPTVTLADGRVVANPLHAVAVVAQAVADKLEAGLISQAEAREALIELAMPTTGVAHDAYRFFTGGAPSAQGLEWLIDSAANPNDLTDAYYAVFSIENRYINFAVNLGVHGAGQAGFAAAYGELTFEAAVAKAYDAIIGEDEARAASLDPQLALDYIEGKESYFRALGASELGAKAAMVGYIISAGVKSQVGHYYEAAHEFIASRIELAGIAYPTEGL